MAQWGHVGLAGNHRQMYCPGAGFIALLSPFAGSSFMLGGNPNLAALIVLALLTLASIAR